MGIINVAWRLAMATVGQNFTKDEHANGWPETLKHGQLAALQYPYARGEAEKRRLAIARAGDILKACQSGELRHTAMIHIPAPAKQPAPLRSPFASAEWQNRDGFSFGGMPARIGYRESGTPPKPVTTYHVTAADFAAWLAAQGEKPSEHIAAWFDAVGVDRDTRPIAPPTGWNPRTEHGLLRFDGTDAGRLVRLADLVTWLMDDRELPCKPAVEVVCTALEGNPSAVASLYLLSENGYAQPLPAGYSFAASFWEEQPQGNNTDKGVVGAVKYMRAYWGESPAPGATKYMGMEVLDPLCIRLDIAFRLWGYGHRVDEVQPDDAPTVAPDSQPEQVASGVAELVWTPERKKEAREMIEKLKREGRRDFRKTTAEHFNVSPQRLDKVLKEKNTSLVQAQSLRNSVFDVRPDTSRVHRIK